MQYDDNIFLYFADFVNQIVLAIRHVQMGTVIALAFKRVWKPGKNNCNIGIFGSFDGFLKQ